MELININLFYVLLHVLVEFVVFKLFDGHIFKVSESHHPGAPSHEDKDAPQKHPATKGPGRKRKSSKADVSLSQN